MPSSHDSSRPAADHDAPRRTPSAASPQAESAGFSSLDITALTPQTILYLQRTIGNRAVQRLLARTPVQQHAPPDMIQTVRGLKQGERVKVIVGGNSEEGTITAVGNGYYMVKFAGEPEAEMVSEEKVIPATPAPAAPAPAADDSDDEPQIVPDDEREHVGVAMGKGAMAPLGLYELHSTESFTGCSAIVMFNAQTKNGGLFHFAGNELQAQAAEMKNMYAALQPTSILICSGTVAVGPQASHQDRAMLEEFFKGLGGSVTFSTCSWIRVTLGEDNNLLVKKDSPSE